MSEMRRRERGATGMHGHDIVVLGFSAGGIEPLLQLVAGLPSDLPASVFVVHHFPAPRVSALLPLGGIAGALQSLIAPAALA